MMKKYFAMLVSMALILSVSVSPVWSAGGKVRSDKAEGPAGTTGDGKVGANRGSAAGQNILSFETLTEEEIDHITYIREEEKLARDVYLTLYQSYEEPIFANISESEQRHMDAVKRLIDNYGLEDPVEDDSVGKFTNQVFTDLYAELVGMGAISYCGALQVGIDIENIDIEDIEIALSDVAAQDVSRVLNNLLNGSYNHLNAFTSQYVVAGCQ
ncbi:MAG: DUF2202 domain-containing protein [Deltaproteobacteria bacterium]|nr:DUF2202 domain-containing protein [Deltaproteobacteria bacterium]